MASRYKLKLKQLDFVSLVDDPAQPNAKCLLIKRKGGNALDVTATARLVKTSDELGLAFFWAFTSTNPDGTDHYDLHGDAVQADNDMIKAAAEFMEKGGAVDEMHASDATGRVVFAMPMTPEIAKAFSVETKTSGLMVAIRPSADAMAKLKSGEYRAVSIAGLGERVEARKSQRVVKSKLYTSETDGHQHLICICEDGAMFAESAMSAGADYWHTHGVVFENGVVTILADSGHTHELAEGQAGVVAVPADAILVVQSPDAAVAMRAPIGKSTQATTPQQGDDMKLVILTEAQHAHYSKLATADAEAFIAKSSLERDVVLADIAKSDPVVFKGELTGFEVRKSQGDFALKMAQAAEKAEKRAADAAERESIEKAAKETEVLKAAVKADIPHLAGADGVKESLYKAAQAIEGGVAMLKAADEAMKSRGVAKGENPGADPKPEGPQAEFDAMVAKHATDNKCDERTARLAVVKTAKGRELYAAIELAKKTHK